MKKIIDEKNTYRETFPHPPPTLYHNNNNNRNKDKDTETPVNALRKVLKDNDFKRLLTCFCDLEFKSVAKIKKILHAINTDEWFYLQLLDELDSHQCGSMTQFLKMMVDNEGEVLFSKKYRRRVERIFAILQQLGFMNYETIDPMTHPSIERLLNSTKFWYLIKHDDNKYNERFDEQIDIYKNADRKIFKSAAADKQRITEAKNEGGHSIISEESEQPEPEVKIAQSDRRLHTRVINQFGLNSNDNNPRSDEVKDRARSFIKRNLPETSEMDPAEFWAMFDNLKEE